MSAVGNWIGLAHAGIWSLWFGMTPHEVNAFAAIYGKVFRSGGDRIPDDILRDTLAQFGDGLSEEEKRELLALQAEQGPDAGSVTEVRGSKGLVLTYQDGRLVEIMLSANHAAAILDGIALFSTESRELLAALETRNGEPGRYRATEAAFDAMAVSLNGFSLLTTRTTRSFRSPQTMPGQATVTLRAAPDDSGEAGYRVLSVR